MRTRSETAALLLLLGSALGSGCDGPRSVPQQPTPLPPQTVADPPRLAGAYALTIHRPDHCTEAPELSNTLRYEATLEPTSYPYTLIRVRGEGYADPTGVGEIWHRPGVPLTVDWNNFDIEGCDGAEEKIGNNLRMICGTGSAHVEGSTIVAEVVTQVWITSDGRRNSVCRGTFAFTFEPVEIPGR